MGFMIARNASRTARGKVCFFFGLVSQKQTSLTAEFFTSGEKS